MKRDIGYPIYHDVVDGKLAGLIVVADEPQPDAKETVEALKALGMERMEMLSGDNGATAKKIAEKLGITTESNISSFNGNVVSSCSYGYAHVVGCEGRLVINAVSNHNYGAVLLSVSLS